jgi:hypothetical protein
VRWPSRLATEIEKSSEVHAVRETASGASQANTLTLNMARGIMEAV